MKLCTRCKRRKPLTTFSKCTKAKDGRFGHCKVCASKYHREYAAAHKDQIAAKHRVYRQTHKDKVRTQACGYRLKRRYGITLVEFNAMRQKQRDRCALCKKPMEFGGGMRMLRAVVDHCHRTGRVRGLIHARCNTLLARAEDSVVRLRQAIKYLQKKHWRASV